MDKLNLIKTITKALECKNADMLMDCDGPKYAFEPNNFEPVIPIFINTENGKRKAFTIKIEQDND